jgi:geranylgeranyl pyrophosphate synthase
MSSEITKNLMADLARRGKEGLEFAKKIMQAEKVDYPKLREALQYYLDNWKDFTHSGLFSLACEAVNGDLQVTLPFQASMAIIAAAFDLHDDIIDQSETKHSVPTVYGKYGLEIALLLGNAFWVEGFTLLVTSIAEIAPNKASQTLRILKTNLYDVGNAHGLELGLKGKASVSPAECMQFVEKKAASVEADMRIGAIFGGGTVAEAEILAKYGRIMGILTTLREEFIDVFEVEELVQKIRIKQLPIPILFAMQEPYRRKKINKILANKNITNEDVEELVELTFESKHVKELKRNMEELVVEATSILIGLSNKKVGLQLHQWVSSMLEDL